MRLSYSVPARNLTVSMRQKVAVGVEHKVIGTGQPLAVPGRSERLR